VRRQRSIFCAAVLLAMFSLVPSVLANTDDSQPLSRAEVSHARVVSLSFVSGTVLTRQPGSPKWADATVDTPIEEGASVATAKHSFAVVRFENGSTARLGELSRVDFTQLALAPRGRHINRLTLVVGFVTIHVIRGRHDDYILNASGATLTPHGKAEFRADLDRGRLRVEVMNGHVQAADSSQSELLGKNQALAYDERHSGAFQVTDSIQIDAWDKWVEARDRQQASLAGYADGWDASVPFGFGGSMGQLAVALGGDSF
jgi:ferric-dicitrate binding protein FerR (iron transport regulator)